MQKWSYTSLNTGKNTFRSIHTALGITAIYNAQCRIAFCRLKIDTSHLLLQIQRGLMDICRTIKVGSIIT
ncbi:MAG: hypothetical protein IKD41_08010, partial [Alistipes sp.]|nr:hypothetical protein [Alistipes sp.]